MLSRLFLLFMEYVVPYLLRAYFITIRIAEDERSRRGRRRPEEHQGVYAFWHAHQLACVYQYSGLDVHILISRSKDGEIVARVAKGMGCRPVRGSTSRGAIEAGTTLIRCAREGRPVAITPDGPRGPRHEVQGGTLLVAQVTRLAIHPVAIGFSDYWELSSWDRFRIPKPFSRGYAMVGEPIHVPRKATEKEFEDARERLRVALNELEQEADRRALDWARRRGGGTKGDVRG